MHVLSQKWTHLVSLFSRLILHVIILHHHIHMWSWCLGINSHIQHIWYWLLVASSLISEAYNINQKKVEDAANSSCIFTHTHENNTSISHGIAHLCGQTKAAQLPWIQHQAIVVCSYIFGGYYSSPESSYRLEDTTADRCSLSQQLDWYAPKLIQQSLVTNTRTNKLISSQSSSRCLTFNALVPLLNSNCHRSR